MTAISSSRAAAAAQVVTLPPQSTPPPLALRLSIPDRDRLFLDRLREAPLPDRVHLFLDRLGEAHLIDPEIQMKIQVWREKFASQYFPGLESPEGKLKAFLNLGLLLCSIIRPHFPEACPNDQAELLAFQDAILAILPQQYIEVCEALRKKRTLFLCKLQMIDAYVQQTLRELCDSANHRIQEIKASFEKIKEHILELNAMQNEVSQAMNEQVRALSERVDQVRAALEAGTEDVRTIGNMMREQQLQLGKLLHECIAVLDGV